MDLEHNIISTTFQHCFSFEIIIQRLVKQSLETKYKPDRKEEMYGSNQDYIK